VLPAIEEYVPATHSVHEIELDAAQEPAGQGMGSSVNEGHFFVSGHAMHEDVAY